MQRRLSPSHPAEHEVVYNLAAYSTGLYLPEAFIVSYDREGYLAHILQKALPATIGSFGLELDPVREQLFSIIDALQPKALEQRFQPKKRRTVPLDELLEDRERRRSIVAFVHRRLDVLLTQVVRHQLPITWEVERKVLVKDFLMHTEPAPLQPFLSFRRTHLGVQYRLRLGREGEAPWKIRKRDVIPVTNHPAWLFVDYRLFRVEHINGNMVKPFRNKGIVTIPGASVKTYFQKFILKVVARVDVEAEGFDIIYDDHLQGCRLEAVRDLFSDRWVLAVRMLYSGAEFNWSDSKDKRTSLQFEEADIRIIQVRRDRKAEQQFLERLNALGVERTTGSYFALPHEEEADGRLLLEWLAEHRARMEEAGFTLATPEVEGSALYLFQPRLEISAEQENDWFDLHGTVTVGDITFPFSRLIPYIRDENPFFPLPNGALFLIPHEWMAKYRGLVQFGRREGGSLRLNKSQYTLLQELGLEEGREVEEQLEATDYQPSSALKARLRPYQLEGVRWLVQLYRNELGGCLADDMGLGKTLQTIAVLLHAKEAKATILDRAGQGERKDQLSLFDRVPDADVLQPLNALIVLPASLVFNWESELNRFAPSLSVYRYVGPKRQKDPRLIARYDVVLTTYQTALRDVSILGELVYEYIVLDESQYIKNRESKVFKAVNELRAQHKISLSGTPIENSLSDLWSQMQFINPDLLGSYSFFRREFIQPIEKLQDEGKKARLRKLVGPYLLRRTKEAVATDLPPLSHQVFYSEMSAEQRRLYDREKSAARNYLLENYDAKNPKYKLMVLRSLTKLRQLANHPRLVTETYQRGSGKFQDVLEHWEQARKSGHKVLFFSFFVKYLELFREYLEGEGQAYAWLSGNLRSSDRESQIRQFEEDAATQAFLISIKSGGTGLNLTAADYVFILDPWWNPFTEQQAIARAHRIGQTKNVMAFKFITRGSIEEKILRLQERKSRLAEDIIESQRKASFSRGELEYLFE